MIKDNLLKCVEATKLSDDDMDVLFKKMLFEKLCVTDSSKNKSKKPKKSKKSKQKFKVLPSQSSSSSESDSIIPTAL